MDLGWRELSPWPETPVRRSRSEARAAVWGWHALRQALIWALSGSGPDGAEEIKRHVFYSTIDWNVSESVHPGPQAGLRLWWEGASADSRLRREAEVTMWP